MEVIKKTVQMAMTTGMTATTSGYSYIIIPNIDAVYHFKIGFTVEMPEIGFFDAFVEPVVPEPPAPPEPGDTYYYTDYDDSIFTDSDGSKFVSEIIL